MIPLIMITIQSIGQSVLNNRSGIQPNGKRVSLYNGQLSFGEGYGTIPFVNDPVSGFYFKSDGNIGVLAGMIPLTFSYSFSDVKNSSSQSNYFHIAFDLEQFKRLQNISLQQTRDSLQKQITKQENLKKNLVRKRLETEYKLHPPAGLTNRLSEKNASELLNKEKKSLPSLDQPLLTPEFDSLANQTISKEEQRMQDKRNKFKAEQLDSSLTKSHLQNSTERAIEQNRDSLERVEKMIDDSIQLVDQTLKKIERVQSYYRSANKAGNFILKPDLSFSFAELLHGLKKLEIGRCNPDYSVFLVSNIVMNGLNAEGEARNIYWAGSVGRTIVRYQANYQPKNPWSQIGEMTNVFNLDDLSQGRRVISIKGGYGRKDNSHVYIGTLWGTGHSTGYYSLVNASNIDDLEKNRVYEIDGQLNLSKRLLINVVLSKSTLKDVATGNDILMPDQAVAKNKYTYSSAAMGRVSYSMPKLNLKLSAGSRWTGPYFRSFGLGFINTDEIKYDLKADKLFGKRDQLTLLYRGEKTNVSHFLNTTTGMASYGISNNLRVSKHIQFRNDFQYTLIHSIFSDTGRFDSKNTGANSSITYSFQQGKFPFSTSLVYTYNQYSAATNSSLYQSASNSFSIMPWTGYSLTNNILLSQRSSDDTELQAARSFSEELMLNGPINKKMKATVRVKYGRSSVRQDAGFGLRLNYSVNKLIEISFNGERFIQTDVLSSQWGNNQQFPYNLFLQLKYHW